MDETGFRIGVGSNKMVVTKRKRKHYLGLEENRESCTAIEAICVDGSYTPAYLVPAGIVHQASWYHEVVGLHPHTVIFPTPTGYSNDEVALDWLRHFIRHTRSKGRYRLLLMDRYGSHHTKQFIELCEDNDIVPFGFPSGLTHLLQPLDLVVFQPLKHYHRDAVEVMVRDGLAGSITKMDFFHLIEDIRKKAFKPSTIQHAFKVAGIHPFRPEPIIQELMERIPETTPPPEERNTENDPVALSSPFEIPRTHRQIYKVGRSIEERLRDFEDRHGDLEGFADLAEDMRAYIRGGEANTAEMIQVKKDLGRTQYAEKLQKARKEQRRQYLQRGGSLMVEEAREMIQKREEDEVAKARRVVERAEKRAATAAKKAAIAARRAEREAKRQRKESTGQNL